MLWKTGREEAKGVDSHDEVLVPEDRVFMEVLSGVEGQIVVLLPVAFSVHEHVGLHDDGLPGRVAQKLEIDFIVPVRCFG